MNNEKLYRFNPFTIQKQTDSEVIEQFTIFSNSLTFGDEPTNLAYDIDLYANMCYLLGEMVARYSVIVANAEAKLKSTMAINVYKERDGWNKLSTEKIPAMSYFENKVLAMYLDENVALNEQEGLLKRYKYAYESFQDKQNALKKKLDAVRFDTLNR